MKISKFVAALGLLSLTSASAMAADMALKAPAPPAPVMSWTGFYIGVNGGAGWATAASNLDLAGFGIPGLTGLFPVASHNLNGFLAGGQIGANYQAGKFLVGVEGDGDWANVQGTAPCIVVFSCAANVRWTADATARAGVLPMPDLLVYVKGGASWAGVNYNFTSPAILGFGIGSSTNVTKVGGLIGFGTEYMFAPHWTAKLEYNFADYGKHTDTFNLTAVGVPGALPVPVQTELQMHTIKGGINYLF